MLELRWYYAHRAFRTPWLSWLFIKSFAINIQTLFWAILLFGWLSHSAQCQFFLLLSFSFCFFFRLFILHLLFTHQKWTWIVLYWPFLVAYTNCLKMRGLPYSSCRLMYLYAQRLWSICDPSILFGHDSDLVHECNDKVFKLPHVSTEWTMDTYAEWVNVSHSVPFFITRCFDRFLSYAKFIDLFTFHSHQAIKADRSVVGISRIELRTVTEKKLIIAKNFQGVR